MELKRIISYYHSKNPLLKWIFWRRLTLAIELVDQELLQKKQLRVADLGFGQGLLLNLLEKYPGDVQLFGLESEPNAMEVQKNVTRAKLTNADLRHSGFESRFFDIAFCLDVIEHFKNLKEPLDEIKRILKPGALLVLSIPTESFFYKMARFTVAGTTSMVTAPCSPHYHTSREVETFLEKSGFVVIKKKFLPPIPFFSLFHILVLKVDNA